MEAVHQHGHSGQKERPTKGRARNSDVADELHQHEGGHQHEEEKR
jgi:hypothetical protein